MGCTLSFVFISHDQKSRTLPVSFAHLLMPARTNLIGVILAVWPHRQEALRRIDFGRHLNGSFLPHHALNDDMFPVVSTTGNLHTQTLIETRSFGQTAQPKPLPSQPVVRCSQHIRVIPTNCQSYTHA